MVRHNPPPGQPVKVQVVKTEEKGSDVNLAVNLVHDAHMNRFDCAVVISGDSDLLGPIKIAKEELGKVVGVLNPQKQSCHVLSQHASFYKHLKPSKIAASLFPDTLTDAKGSFSKPPTW